MRRWVCLLLLMACGSPKPSQECLRLSFFQDPTTLDPRLGGDLVSSQIQFLLFEGLTRLNPDGSISPALAESIILSDDRLVYTFCLRKTKWSNGDPVTAYDFERSWKEILSPSSTAVNAPLFYSIQNAYLAKQGHIPIDAVGIRALNDHTLQVTLETPTPYFLSLLSFCVFSPVHESISMSNGPYRLAAWRFNQELCLERNPLYWDPTRTLFDKIHISIIHQPSTALQLFEKGDLDMIGSIVSPLPVDALPHLMKNYPLKTQPLPASTILCFNTCTFPFHNVHLRKAFSYAIAREEIVDHLLLIHHSAIRSFLPPLLHPHEQALLSNPSLAQQELELALQELQISQEDLSQLTYYYPASDTHRQVAQAIQQQIFDTLGISIQLATCESKVLLDKLIKRDFTLAQTMWMAQYRDPMSLLERLKLASNPKNYSGWEDPEYIQLLELSAQTIGLERTALLDAAEALLIEQVPVTPIYHWEEAYLLQPELQHLCLSPIGDLCHPP